MAAPRPGIPARAHEEVVERRPDGAKSRSRYYLGGGKKHGLSVEWWDHGVVSFAEPWRASDDRPARPRPPELAGQPIGIALSRRKGGRR